MSHDATLPASAGAPVAARAGRRRLGAHRHIGSARTPPWSLVLRRAGMAMCMSGLVASAAAGEVDDPLLALLQARGVVAAPAAGTAPSASMAEQAPKGPSNDTSELVLAAMNFLDIQYRFGGDDAREGFDCSGFTRHVFATALGLTLPRRAEAQAQAPSLHAVGRDALAPGDLVFFNTLRRTFSHVGLYIGDGRFVHAPRAGAQVRVERMDTLYWASRFDGARRLGIAATVPSVVSVAEPPNASAAKAADAGIEAWASPN